MRVLLTSFEPFGGHDRNSSAEVAGALVSSPPPGLAIEPCSLPVVADVCVDMAWQKVESFQPQFILALGQAGGATHIRLEDRAVNRDHFTMPDNAGIIRQHQPILSNGPAILRTNIPIENVLISIRRQGFAVLHSLSAGTYICNHLYYHLLFRAQTHQPIHRTLFVHLPYLPDQTAVGAFAVSVPLADQLSCLQAILASCLNGHLPE